MIFQCNIYVAPKQVFFQMDTGFRNRLEIWNLSKCALLLELEVFLQIGQSSERTRLCSDACADNIPLMEKDTISLYFLSLKKKMVGNCASNKQTEGAL